MKKILVFMWMIAAAVVLNACGGSGSSSGTPSPTNPQSATGTTGTTTSVPAPIVEAPTAISDKDAAARAVNATKTLSSSFVLNSSLPRLDLLKPVAGQAANGNQIISTIRDLQQMVAGVVEKQKMLGKQVAAASSEACTDGGQVSYDTVGDQAVVTYNACKINDEYKNGSITMPQALGGQASGADFTISLNLTTVVYEQGSGYTTKKNESAQNYMMTVKSFDEDAGISIFTTNGTQSEIDYAAPGTSNKLSFKDFELNMTESMSGSVTTTDMTMNGTVSIDSFKNTVFIEPVNASGMAFSNLRIKSAVDATNNINSLDITGTYAIKSNPACLDGTFEISTQTQITGTGSGIISGQMTVNGIVMVFNADGTVTATIDNAPQTIGADYASVCSLSF